MQEQAEEMRNEPTIHLADQVEIIDRTTPAYLLKEAEKLKASLRNTYFLDL